nr:hypothetical protein Iba_chr04aCG21120 [Ipomoea batatas]GMC87063.1 hypothetical protein Iba_chr04dCG16710 [Ipomoea batatas]
MANATTRITTWAQFYLCILMQPCVSEFLLFPRNLDVGWEDVLRENFTYEPRDESSYNNTEQAQPKCAVSCSMKNRPANSYSLNDEAHYESRKK